MPKKHNIQKKCTDHTYGTCAGCGYIAQSPWSTYLDKLPFEEQFEIIELEEGPCGRIRVAPDGTPPYIGALMTNAEMYPVDIIVPKDSMTCIVSVESSKTKHELSSVSISYKKKYSDRKKRSSKKDTYFRKKQSWKKAHSNKMSVSSVSIDDFLIPAELTPPKYRNRIRKWCRCCNSIVKIKRKSIVCKSCRKDKCFYCGESSEILPICPECDYYLREFCNINTLEDVKKLKQDWINESFAPVMRRPKYELCYCGFYYKSSYGRQMCGSCEYDFLEEERMERMKEARKMRRHRRGG